MPFIEAHICTTLRLCTPVHRSVPSGNLKLARARVRAVYTIFVAAGMRTREHNKLILICEHGITTCLAASGDNSAGGW